MIIVISLTVLQHLKTARQDLTLGRIDFESFESRLKKLESDPEATRCDIAKINLALGMALLNLQRCEKAAWVLRGAFVWQLPDGEKGLPLVCRAAALFGQAEENQTSESERTIQLEMAERVIHSALTRLKENTPLYGQAVHLQIRIEAAKRKLDPRRSSCSPIVS